MKETNFIPKSQLKFFNLQRKKKKENTEFKNATVRKYLTKT